MYATAARGTEPIVAHELKYHGFHKVKPGHGGVHFDGDLGEAMRACLHLRSALRVLWPLTTFPAATPDELYAAARDLPWEEHLGVRTTFAVSATTRAPAPMAHGPHLALKLKDAIVDRMRDLHGARPDVSREDPDVRLYLHVETPARSRGGVPGVTVGLDVSGDSLHARGYRVAEGPAPLRESLAAAIVLLTEWDGGRAFVDPMCGSGTLVIEAAMLAARIAPGRVGRVDRFGFLRWPGFGDSEAKRWKELCAEADARALPRAPRAIIGSDRDPEAVAATRANAAAAHPAVAASLSLREADARELGPTDPPGLVVTNPPYGERIGGGSGLEPFWWAFGQQLRKLRGHSAFVLVPEGPAENWLAMRPAWQWRLMNGPLAVALNRYDMPSARSSGSPPR